MENLQEFIAQATKGLQGRIFGADFMKKQTYLQVSNIFTETYGQKVWDALNNRTVFFNAIPKVAWGPTTGWRNRTDRGSGRSRPVTETGALPTVDVSNYVNISSLPRITATDFGVSIKSIFTAGLEGGIGDALAVERSAAERDHVKEINEELTAGTGYLTSAGSTTAFTVPASIAHHFKIGDRVGAWQSSSTFDEAQGGVVSAVDTTTGVVTVSTMATGWADGRTAYILSRAGFTSIDDIITEDDAVTGGGKIRSDVYNLTTRTAGTYAAAGKVDVSSTGTGRDLSLTLLDQAILKIRENGGEPKLIYLGHDQYFNLQALLQAQQRFMGVEEITVGVGDERTYPGTKTGLVVATYLGIPVLPDPDCPKSVSSADAVLGSNVYVLDTDYIEYAVAMPTQYIEDRSMWMANAMVVRGLLYTMGELRCKNIWVQAKIGDLNAS